MTPKMFNSCFQRHKVSQSLPNVTKSPASSDGSTNSDDQVSASNLDIFVSSVSFNVKDTLETNLRKNVAIYNIQLYYNLQFTMLNTVVFSLTLCNYSLRWSPLLDEHATDCAECFACNDLPSG